MKLIVRVSAILLVSLFLTSETKAFYPPPIQVDAGFNFWFNVKQLDAKAHAGPWYLYFPHEAHFQTPARYYPQYPNWPGQWPPKSQQQQSNSGNSNSEPKKQAPPNGKDNTALAHPYYFQRGQVGSYARQASHYNYQQYYQYQRYPTGHYNYQSPQTQFYQVPTGSAPAYWYGR